MDGSTVRIMHGIVLLVALTFAADALARQDTTTPTTVLNGGFSIDVAPARDVDSPSADASDVSPSNPSAPDTSEPDASGQDISDNSSTIASAIASTSVDSDVRIDATSTNPAGDETVAATDQRPLGAPTSSIESTLTLPTDATTSSVGIGRDELLRVGGALAVVIGLIVVLRVLMSRAGLGPGHAARPSGVVEVLARFPVSRGQQIMIVRFARRLLLVQQGSHGMTTLSEVSDPDEVAGLLARIESGSRGRTADKFRAMLEQFESEHEGAPGFGEQREVIDLTRSRGNRFRGRLAG